jgi:hypothetical protein
MIVEYTCTTEDIVALTADQLTKPSAKKEIRSNSIWIGAVLFLGFAYSAWDRGMILVGVGVLPGVGAFLLYPSLARRFALSKARKLFSDPIASKGAVGWQRVSLEADGFRQENAVGSATVRYDSVASISETSDHAFVYFSEAVAVVIPRRAVTSGDLASLLRELAARVSRTSATRK